MLRKNQKSRHQAYKLIILCTVALVLGCVIPLSVHITHQTIAAAQLAAMETVSGLVMLYIFGDYLVKK